MNNFMIDIQIPDIRLGLFQKPFHIRLINNPCLIDTDFRITVNTMNMGTGNSDIDTMDTNRRLSFSISNGGPDRCHRLIYIHHCCPLKTIGIRTSLAKHVEFSYFIFFSNNNTHLGCSNIKTYCNIAFQHRSILA